MTFMDPFPRGTRRSQEFRASPGGYNPRGGHTGRDYAVPVGTPIRAAADGIIRHSSWLGRDHRTNPWWLTDFGGDTLVLDCTDAFGRTETMPTFIYAHCANSIAEVGQRVKKGQVIAISGNTGTATSGPHCHVERLNPGYDLNSDVYGRAPLDFDEYWGDIAPQGSTTEDDMPSAKEVADEIFTRKFARADGGTVDLGAIVSWYDANNAAVIKGAADEVLNRQIHWAGFDGSGKSGERTTTSLAGQVAWLDTQHASLSGQIAAQGAQIASLIGALSAVTKGEAFDEAKLLAGVQTAAAAGVKAAIESIDTTITLKGE